MVPGEYTVARGDIELNPGRETVTLAVKNMGDRPIQVGSHYHFYEVNSALEFDRKKTLGFHLDIPSGSAVRFEPGEEKTVRLVAFGGRRLIYGFHNAVNDFVK